MTDWWEQAPLADAPAAAPVRARSGGADAGAAWWESAPIAGDTPIVDLPGVQATVPDFANVVSSGSSQNLGRALGDDGDYSSVFRDDKADNDGIGRVLARAGIGRVPELLANLIELPANANEAVVRTLGGDPDEPGLFSSMRSALRSGAGAVRELGYEDDMQRAGWGDQAKTGADALAAVNPMSDMGMVDRLKTVGTFVPETLAASLPDMLATITPAGLAGYMGARTNEIAEDRADNDKRADVGLGDLALGGVAAPIEALLERFTTMRLLPNGTTAATPGVLPAIARIAKELGIQGSLGGVEELVPYLAETVGTETGASAQGALETFVSGALAEGALGGTVQTGREALASRSRARPSPLAPLGEAPPVATAPPALGALSPAEAAAPADLGAVLEQIPPDVVEAALVALGDPAAAVEPAPEPLGGPDPAPAAEPSGAPAVPPTPEPAPVAAEPAPPAGDGDIGAALQARIDADPQAVAAQYDALPDSDGGRILNTDIARELSPEYKADMTRSAEVHEAASAFIKRRYADKLSRPTPEGADRVVMLTAGGTGAGKTTAVREAGDVFGRPEIVYDTNMNTLASAEQKVQQALDAGRAVQIVYVYRDPVEALTGGAIGRAKRMAAKSGTGRTVPIEEHAKTHAGVRRVMDALAERYRGDDRVRIDAIDNSHGLHNSRAAELADLPQVEEHSLRERLSAALEEARAAGLDEALYRGFAARGRPVLGGEGVQVPQGVRGRDGEGDGRRAEQAPARVADDAVPRPDGSADRDGAGADTSASPDTARLGPEVDRRSEQGRDGERGNPVEQDDASERGAQSRPEAVLRTGSDPAAFPTPVDELSRALDPITSKWRGDRPLVRYLQHADELPASAQRMDGWQTAEGWYDGRSTIYLVASNIESVARGEQVLAHEAIGHYGVEGVVSKATWARVLADVARLRARRADLRPDLQAALASAESRYGDQNASVFARELLAVMAEGNVRASVMDRVLAALRTGLRRFGFDVDGWAESTLRQVLAEGARRVQRGGRDVDRSGTAGFSQPAATAAPSGPAMQGRNTNLPGNPDDVRNADRGPRPPGLLARERQAIEDQVDGLRRFLSERPRNPESIGKRLEGIRSAVFDSIMSRARDLERNNPQSNALPELFNMVMAAPGDSRLVGETVNDAIQSRFATFTNRARNVLGNNSLDRMTPIENAQLRAAMLDPQAKVPVNIRAAATQLRRLMDVQREDMLSAGIEIGEVTDTGYLTRIYDETKILDDRSGFLDKATTLFREHEFALDVGTTPAEIMYGDGTLARFLGYAKRAATGDKRVADALDRIKTLLRGYRFSSNVNNETKQIQAAVADIHDAVRDDWAAMRAAAWLHGLSTPDVRSFASGVSPSGSPITKGRELSAAADSVMATYLKTDMLDILDSYARTAAKKIEHAVRFGPDGSRLQELIDQASTEGVPKPDMEQAINLVDSVLGLNSRPPESALKRGADFLHTWTYLALLGRATFSSLAEAVTFALRTGNLVHTVAPLIQVQRAVTRSKKGKDLNELAQVIAVNGNKAVEEVLMNRLGGDYAMTPRWSALLHRFFYATLLTPLTRAQRAYGVGAATGFLRQLSRNVEGGKDTIDTTALLNEVGIADHQEFAQWMLAQGALPDPRGLFDENGRPTPRGQDYMVAVRRIIDQAIQNPGAEHRPAWTNSPGGRLMTGIMSFSYASYENIIKREAALMARNLRDQGRMKALERNAIALSSAAALVVAQTITSTVRELLFNSARFEDKDEEEMAKELVALGVSRTFGLGSADPIVQYLTGLKYQRSLSEIALGAGPGLVIKAIDSVGMLFTDRNSSNTDTQEFRAAQNAWTVAVAPVLSIILSRIPVVGGPAVMVASGGNVRDQVVSQFIDKPEKKSHLDKQYEKASKDLEVVLGVVNDRIAALPQEQWQAELEVLKAEYPSILAGVTLDVYADIKQNRKAGRAGMPKTAGRDDKPGLRLESPKSGQGSVLGELEGYERYDRFKKKYVSDDGLRDDISDLNKAIKNVRSDDALTIGDLIAFAPDATSVAPMVEQLWQNSGSIDQEKPVDRGLRSKVLDELMEMRRDKKRAALDVLGKGKRGEPIARAGSAAD